MSDVSQPLRILHVAESARGGVGTYLNQTLPDFADALSDAGISSDMRLVMPAEHRFMLPRVEDHIIQTYSRDGRGVLALGRLALATWRELRRFRPDIVHLHSTLSGAIVRPMLLVSRLLFSTPRAVIYSPHGWAFQITGSALRQRAIVIIERVLSLMTDQIIVLSEAERQECLALGFSPDKLRLVYNGVQSKMVSVDPAPWPDTRLKVFFVGRFDRQKGLDTLMAAARLVPDRMCVRCAGASVVGDDSTQDVSPPNVELLGWMNEDQIERQFAAADIVAIPSRWEGFGLVAAEAMRAGLPVVASRVGGLPEVVEDGVTGRLIPPDDAAALAHALLAGDTAERRKMGEAGRRRYLDRFTARHSARAMSAVYAGVVRRLVPARPAS